MISFGSAKRKSVNFLTQMGDQFRRRQSSAATLLIGENATLSHHPGMTVLTRSRVAESRQRT
jgi:hypothetical protein